MHPSPTHRATLHHPPTFFFPRNYRRTTKEKKKKKKTMLKNPPTKATASQILQRGRERGAPKSETKKK